MKWHTFTLTTTRSTLFKGDVREDEGLFSREDYCGAVSICTTHTSLDTSRHISSHTSLLANDSVVPAAASHIPVKTADGISMLPFLV